MTMLSLLMLVLQVTRCLCSDYYDYYDNEIRQDEAFSAEDVKAVDVSVKNQLIGLVSSRWEAVHAQFQQSQDQYHKSCEEKFKTTEKECIDCAKKLDCIIPKMLEIFAKQVWKKFEDGLKDTYKGAERIVTQTHEAVKKTVEGITKGAKKVVVELVKGTGKLTRKVTRVVSRVVRHVTRKVTRVVRHVTRQATRIVRSVTRKVTRIASRVVRGITRIVPRIRFRVGGWGKRDLMKKRLAERGILEDSGKECAEKCSSCRKLTRAAESENFDEICGQNSEGDRLKQKLQELDKQYPSEEIPIVKNVTREIRKGKECTVVQMNLKEKTREIWFPSAFFDDFAKLVSACFKIYKKRGGILLT